MIYFTAFYRVAALCMMMMIMITQGASKAEPTVLALGVDGGFRTDEQKYDVIKTHRLVAFKPGSAEGLSVSYPDEVRVNCFLQ